jgi:hypothetical protein
MTQPVEASLGYRAAQPEQAPRRITLSASPEIHTQSEQQVYFESARSSASSGASHCSPRTISRANSPSNEAS